MRCPDDALLAAWVDGEADRSISAHLDDCGRCVRVVHGHQQVKRRTASLSARPAPAPGRDLLSCLLTVPVVEHTREREARCAAPVGQRSWPTGLALGAAAGVGLVALAWMAPLQVGGHGAVSPGTAPASRAPATVSNVPPTAQVSPVRWMRSGDRASPSPDG